jgi:hypothetical protein
MSFLYPGLSTSVPEFERDTTLRLNFSAFVPPLPAGCRRRHVLLQPLGPPAVYSVVNTSAPNRVRYVLPPELGFVDPSSLFLQMTCLNQSSTTAAGPVVTPRAVHFLPGGLIRSLRVLCGGRVVEEINNYAEYNTFIMRTQKQNFLSYSGGILAGTGLTLATTVLDAGATRTYCIPLLSALTNYVRNLLPLALLTNSLWLEIDWNSAAECMSLGAAPAGETPLRRVDVSNLVLHFDALTFDDSFVSELRAAASVAPVQLFSRTWTTHMAFMAAGLQRHQILLPLKDPVHCVVHGETPEDFYDNSNPLLRVALAFLVNDASNYQYQLGARMLPELPVQGRVEAFWHVLRSLGIHADPYREAPALNTATSLADAADMYVYGFLFDKVETDTGAFVGNAYPFDRSPDQLSLVLNKDGVANVAARHFTFACIDALFAVNVAGVLQRVPV